MRILACMTALWFGLAFMTTGPGPESLPRVPTPPASHDVRYDAEFGRMEMDVNLLAEIAMAEDPIAGSAVMWVIVNRSQESGCPLLAEVIRERAFGTHRTWSDGRHEWRPAWWPGKQWSHPLDRAMLRRLRRLAWGVLLGEVPDPTGGSTHFHATGTWRPSWAPDPDTWVEVGRSQFYRERNSS